MNLAIQSAQVLAHRRSTQLWHLLFVFLLGDSEMASLQATMFSYGTGRYGDVTFRVACNGGPAALTHVYKDEEVRLLAACDIIGDLYGLADR